MVSYRFRFKKRGAEQWTKIDLDANGTMHLPSTELKSASETMGNIQRAVLMLQREGWVEAEIKEIE